MLVIAHRGASGRAPENTLAAFRLALQMGAKALEFDVHQTLDGELVVGHDDDLRRCGGGDKRRMKSLRWAGEAENVDVGSWFDKRFSAERLPLLDDVYALAPAVELHLELKHGSSTYPGIEKRVLDLVRRRGALSRTLVSSFDHEALYAVRSLDEKARLGYLLGLSTLKKAFREMKELSAESLNLGARQATARIVKTAHDRGLKVYVYTVNTPVERDRLEALGVDGIFSNYPELDLWR